MKKHLSYGIFTLALCLILISCGDDDSDSKCPPAPQSTLKLSFVPTWDGMVVEDGAEYADQHGNSLLQFNFKAFVSKLKLTGENLETDLSEVELLALGDGTVDLFYTVPANVDFNSLLFHTGVPPEYNVDYNPTNWPNDHPLSVQGAQGMHWGWNTGYIFTKFDGKADTLGTTNPGYLYPFAFHTGDDAFYTAHSLSVNIAPLVNDTSEITVMLAMEMLLNSVHDIDIRIDGETHTGGDFDLAQKFIDNFNQCFSIE